MPPARVKAGSVALVPTVKVPPLWLMALVELRVSAWAVVLPSMKTVVVVVSTDSSITTASPGPGSVPRFQLPATRQKSSTAPIHLNRKPLTSRVRSEGLKAGVTTKSVA